MRAERIYINMKQAIKDYNRKHNHKITQKDIACYIFEGKYEDKDNCQKVFSRKSGNYTKYEFTITDLYNICKALKIDATTFYANYTKVKRMPNKNG